MTRPTATTTNIARDGASVAVQADVVHIDNLYQVKPEDTPEERFDVGLRLLQGGMPAEARECISKAVALGYVTSRSLFYLLMAQLSGRTVQQMNERDFSVLRSVRGQLGKRPRDRWSDGIRAVVRVVESLDTQEHDPRVLIKELDELGHKQRDEIARHLEIFLRGPLEDWLWKRVIQRAREEQCADRRTDRVWKFFQPVPAGPRVRQVHPVTIGLVRWARCIAATALVAVLAGYVVRTAWRADWLTTVLTLLPAIGAFVVSARFGADWRHRVLRRRAKDNALSPRQRRSAKRDDDGFAKRIDTLFHHYFSKYVPPDADSEAWLKDTLGIRQVLRDEIVEVYREQRVDAKSVAWLVRYLVSDVKRRWQDSTLWAYRDELRISLRLRLVVVLTAAVFVVAVGRLIGVAFVAGPLGTVGATLLGLIAGGSAARDWLAISVERRRYAADAAEIAQEWADREAAHARWCQKLADKPSDLEMARWLDSDRKVLTDLTMKHYRLSPRDIITHAFIEAPAAHCKRARVRNGPLRYSRYRLLVFLLTVDGVRQLTVALDFENASFHDRDRLNYRYDAVAAVQVVESDDGHRKTFELTLVSSYSINAEVTSTGASVMDPEEDSDTVSRMTLDAAGISNTLHVLEGIAAEGRQWIDHERRREGSLLGAFAKTLHGIVGLKAGSPPQPV
jgi:hypothetical protein